jgi:methane monooxygenase component A gamma chain
VREQWQEKVNSIRNVKEGVQLLKEFRSEHLSPRRKTQELKKEAGWIESRIEMRVAQLHAEATPNDQDLLTKTIDGRCAAEVCKEWLKRAEKIDCAIEMNELCMAFRRENKPPMMPINYLMPTERDLVSKLLKLRAPTYLSMPLDELRTIRGATRISVQ